MKIKNVVSIIALLLVVLMLACKKDDKSGAVTGLTTDPLNNVTGVSRNKAIAFTFSESMDPLTINTSHFEGVILSMTGITFQTGATMNGRALAQTAVVLDVNTVTRPI
jgi:hypothetical protein